MFELVLAIVQAACGVFVLAMGIAENFFASKMIESANRKRAEQGKPPLSLEDVYREAGMWMMFGGLIMSTMAIPQLIQLLS